jgi:hypothetical protein
VVAILLHLLSAEEDAVLADASHNWLAVNDVHSLLEVAVSGGRRGRHVGRLDWTWETEWLDYGVVLLLLSASTACCHCDCRANSKIFIHSVDESISRSSIDSQSERIDLID